MHSKHLSYTVAAVASLLASTAAAPVNATNQELANTTYGPIPGEDTQYSTYYGKGIPFPGNLTAPIYPTTSGPAGADDLLFQNLLAAEWVIFSFYQSAVEAFNQSSFESLGFPNTTYQRITEIRDNEAGHLRLFQNQISSASLKPGACKYAFPYTNATTFLALETLIEVSSMAFLTGLAEQATLNSSKGALIAVAETESRHNTFLLIDVWNVDPFAGPSDTVFPYANLILDTTSAFVVPGSCPAANPTFPTPKKVLPQFSAAAGTKSLTPGSSVVYSFAKSPVAPAFDPDKEYYAVYFHGLTNITVPFDTKTNLSMIPAAFETKGVIVAVISDTPGAPTEDSVLAGPGIILEQPSFLAVALAS